MLSGPQDGSLAREAMIYKLAWSSWHVELGKLAMDVLGMPPRCWKARRMA